VDLSFRIQNLQDNSSFDGFSSGKNTLRARVGVNYQLNKRWSVGTDVTQDLMDRGDGTTLSVGASYGLPLSDRSTLSLSAGVNWATADHWATQLRLLPPPAGGWHSGLGSLGLGMSYRYALTPQWAWFGTVGSSRHLGQVDAVSPSTLSWSGQIGVLYFSR
jgi:outer membrane scaffolding protein for murein synthesis (MipA/OmpV family)